MLSSLLSFYSILGIMITRFYEGPLTGANKELQNRIVTCKACPRLVKYREQKALFEKKPRFANVEHWGAPVPSHGDPQARLLIVGLAPGADGANRTGRLFTGDSSSNFLIKSLYSAGLTNKDSSEHISDGLALHDVFISSAIHCLPPNDKPTPTELSSCKHFLSSEIQLLARLKAILVFGHIAFRQVQNVVTDLTNEPSRHKFIHGGQYQLPSLKSTLFASYHPSPRNTNTGKLDQTSLDTIFNKIMGHIRSFD